jgi:hypothetical protein
MSMRGLYSRVNKTAGRASQAIVRARPPGYSRVNICPLGRPGIHLDAYDRPWNSGLVRFWNHQTQWTDHNSRRSST